MTEPVNPEEFIAALFDPSETVTDRETTTRFHNLLAQMEDEKFSFVAMAYAKAVTMPWVMTKEEQEALMRVCARIIRESKENKESQ